MSYIGSTKIGKMYLGSTAIAKAYLGSDVVYEASSGEDPSSTEGWTWDKRLNTAGETSTTGFCITCKYAVSEGDYIVITAPSAPGTNCGDWVYDDDGNGRFYNWAPIGSSTSANMTVPSGYTYARFSLKTSLIDGWSIYNNTTGKYLYKGVNV